MSARRLYLLCYRLPPRQRRPRRARARAMRKIQASGLLYMRVLRARARGARQREQRRCRHDYGNVSYAAMRHAPARRARYAQRFFHLLKTESILPDRSRHMATPYAAMRAKDAAAMPERAARRAICARAPAGSPPRKARKSARARERSAYASAPRAARAARAKARARAVHYSDTRYAAKERHAARRPPLADARRYARAPSARHDGEQMSMINSREEARAIIINRSSTCRCQQRRVDDAFCAKKRP